MDQDERRGEERRGLLFTSDKLEKHVADRVSLSKIQVFLWKSVWFWKLLLTYSNTQLQELHVAPARLLNWPWPCSYANHRVRICYFGIFFFFSKLQSKSKTQGISGGVSFFNLPRQRAEDFINIYFLTTLCEFVQTRPPRFCRRTLIESSVSVLVFSSKAKMDSNKLIWYVQNGIGL